VQKKPATHLSDENLLRFNRGGSGYFSFHAASTRSTLTVTLRSDWLGSWDSNPRRDRLRLNDSSRLAAPVASSALETNWKHGLPGRWAAKSSHPSDTDCSSEPLLYDEPTGDSIRGRGIQEKTECSFRDFT
jgi:hypothetical protein